MKRQHAPNDAPLPPREERRESGQALLMALAILLFVLPMGIALSTFVSQTMKSAMAERRQKNASQTANNAMTDYMRQFSQDANNGHYDLDALSRPETFYDAGYSTVTFESDEASRSLYVSARGVTNSSEKGIEALVRFVSDMTQYGTMFNRTVTLNAPNVYYSGPFYVKGTFTTQGTGVIYTGPLFVNGNAVASAATTVQGDMYYSGSRSGTWNVGGASYNYVPALTWPVLDFNYYEAHYTFKSTSSVEITFYSTGTFRVTSGASYVIPSNGAIIYGYNANLTLKGAVAGRVTAVAVSTGVSTCSSGAGKITFSDNLYYASGSSISASSQNSFAALATNCVAWDPAGSSNIVTVGVNFVQNTGSGHMYCYGGGSSKFWIYGTRTESISLSGCTAPLILYDPNLATYPPPGVPEKAQLVNYRML